MLKYFDKYGTEYSFKSYDQLERFIFGIGDQEFLDRFDAETRQEMIAGL